MGSRERKATGGTQQVAGPSAPDKALDVPIFPRSAYYHSSKMVVVRLFELTGALG